MNQFLPTYTHWPRLASTLLLGVLVSLSVYAQDEEDPEEEDEPEEVEVIKQLVFIEEQFDTASSNVTGTIERLRQPYDVVVSPDGGHLYLASQSDHGISIFARDETEGTLTFVDDVDELSIGEDALRGARSIAISPDGEFAYAVSMFAGSNGGSLSSFDRNTTSGTLTFIDAIYDEDPGIDGLQGARSIAVSPDGKNLYVAAYEDDKVSVFSRNSETGVASFLGVYEEGDQGVEELSEPHAITVSPDGQFVYVALYTNQIIVFSRDDTNGLLTYISKLSYLLGENGGLLKGTPRAIAISPDGAFVYVTSWNTDSLSVFARDSETGELTHENDYKNDIGDTENMDSPHDIVISADGRYVYVAAFSSDSVTSFQRDLSTGELSYFQSILSDGEETWSMNGPLSIAASPDGEHVYVGSGSGDHSLTTFRREILVDPPEFVVQPIARSIEEGESVAFHALAQGESVSYQWLKNGVTITNETLPVFTINTVAPSNDGDVYSIVASNSGGSVSSDNATLTVLPPIIVEAPIDLTALDISSTSADLAWKDQSDNETSFEIQRRIIGGEFAALVTVLANQNQYSDTTIEASTTYRYRVAAKRNDSYSLWSNDAVIESYDDIPQTPASLTLIEETYNKVRIAWSDRSAVEDGYTIFRRRDEIAAMWEEIATADADSNQYTDRTVAPDATYAYRVQAFNESGASDYSNSVVALTSSIPVTGISPVARSIPRDDISGYGISVTSTKAWEAVPSESWLVIDSPADGEGFADEPVSYRALLNESQGERTGVIVVGGLDHTVTQGGSPPFMRIQPVRTEITSAEGTRNISIQSNVDWVAAESADWIEITAGATGSNYGTVQLAIDANDSFNARSAIIQINDQSHLVDQEGKAEVLEFTSNITTYPDTASSGAATITANIPWTAIVSEDWIQITSATTGSSDATLTFEIEANETQLPRTTDILVNDIAISITQEATLHFLSLSSDDRNMARQSGSGEVTINSNTQWNASVYVNWINITSDLTGEGNATLTFDIDENKTQNSRTTTIQVNNVSISITQATFVISTSLPVPEFDSVDISSGIGAELAWSDNSTTEIGFFIRRGIVGTNKFIDLVELPANTTSYFDRTAPRGKALEYRIAAIDNIGRSTEDSITSATLPESNLTTIVTRVRMSEEDQLAYAHFTVDGYEPLTQKTRGFGPTLSRLLGNTTSTNWSSTFGENFTPTEFPIIEHSAQSTSTTHPRGVAALGYIDTPEAVIPVAFEITGAITLPILIKGIGPGLTRQRISNRISDPRISLYRIEADGNHTLLSSNDDWGSWTDNSQINLESGIEKTNSAQLDAGSKEALIIRDLPAGRYLVILKGNGLETGMAMLELYDLR